MNTGWEYGIWIEEQNRRVSEIRTALQTNISDVELQILVDSCLNHYASLFRIKADAARADECYLLSGLWRTSTERLFQWIGGFRPSELLNLLLRHLRPLTGQQLLEVVNLRQSSQYAEDALSQGIDKIKEVLAERIATDITVVESTNFVAQMAGTVETLSKLVHDNPLKRVTRQNKEKRKRQKHKSLLHMYNIRDLFVFMLPS